MIRLLFAFSIIVLSQAPILVRFAHASSLAICFWRLLIAAVILLPFALRKDRLAHLKRLPKGHLAQLFLCGAFLFLHFYFFFRSVQESSVANASILFSLNPVTTALGAFVLFGERLSRHLLLACLLGFAGVTALFGETLLSSGGHLLGDFWGILAPILFSGYILTGKRVRQELGNVVFASAIYFQTVVWAGLVMLFQHESFTGFDSGTWWAFLAMAIFPTLLGHAIFTYCLNYLNVNFMSCMTLVEPVLAAAVASYLFGERLSHFAAIGFALTCASVLVLYWPAMQTRLRERRFGN